MESKKIFLGIGWSFAERFFAQIISLIVSIVLARLLSPDNYGILAIVNVFVSIGDALVTGGFGTALVQKKSPTQKDFNSIYCLSILISVFLYILLFFFAPIISLFYANKKLTLITRILGLRLIFSSINSIQQAYVQKKLLFKKNFIISSIAAIIAGIIGIGMAIMEMGIWALIIQNLSFVIISTMILFFYIEWKPKFEYSIISIKEMWGYGSRVFLATLVDTFKDNIRTLVVGKVFSPSDLAYYNQGKRFPQLLVNDIINSIGKVLFPFFSEEQENLEKNKKLMRVSIRLSSFIFLPLIFGLVGIADNFILLFLGEKWEACIPYLKILSFVYTTRSINSILKHALLALGKSEINLFHEVITSLLTIIFIFLGAILFKNIKIIAWSYVLISLVGTIIFSFFIIKYYSYKPFEILKDYGPSFLLSVFMCIVVYFLGKINFSLILLLFLQTVTGIFIYFFGAWILKMEELNYFLNYIKGCKK